MAELDDDLSIPDPTPSGFRGYLSTMPRWKKVMIGGAASSFALALVTVFLEDGRGGAANTAEGGGEAGALRSTLTGEEIPPPEDGAPAAAGEPAWSQAFLKYGFSFFVGFAVGLAVRMFIKMVFVAVGCVAVALFLLSHGGFITVNWTAMDTAFNDVVGSVSNQFQGFRSFITGSLPNAGLAGLGLYTGFKKNV